MEDTEVVVVEDVPRPGLWLVSLPQSMLTTPLRFHGGNMQDHGLLPALPENSSWPLSSSRQFETFYDEDNQDILI